MLRVNFLFRHWAVSIFTSTLIVNKWALINIHTYLYLFHICETKYIWKSNLNARYVLQAVSVIGAHHVIRVAILRALRYSLWCSHKTWILRISCSSADAISVIRAAITPLAWYQISIVARIASWIWLEHYYGFRAPGAVTVMTRRDPKGIYLGDRR